MIEIFETPTHYYMALDLIQGKDLFDYLAERNYALPEARACHIIFQLANALAYLKAFGVVHRDLKLENIMMSDNTDHAIPKIIDFGLARILYPGERTTEPYGTLGYVSPEILRKDPYSYECDVWSIGCITYALLSGALPFDNQDPKKTIEFTKEHRLKFDMPCWKNLSVECMDFINCCLLKDHTRRITLSQLLRHQWFRTLN